MSGRIPKVIHYCWFGGAPLPKLAVKCIESWKKYCPDYEIREWNESNFDVRCCPYVAQAYEAKKYAFVSDFARYKILYEHGGVYFDTDVELLKPIDNILQQGSFMGIESMVGECPTVAPGLGIAAEAFSPTCWNLMNSYFERVFRRADGSLDLTTVVEYATDYFCEKGLTKSEEPQLIDDMYIYPQEYFNPCNRMTGKITITEKTVSIHHYTGSWVDRKSKLKRSFIRFCKRCFGEDVFRKLKKVF